MYCSGCGQALEPGQTVCPQCNRSVAPMTPLPPPVPGLQFELEHYAGKVKVLGILWLVYAGLSILLGFAGLTFARALMAGGFGPWMHGPWMNGPGAPNWVFPIAFHLAWLFLSIRAVVCALAGWGLLEHTGWGRIAAIVIGILSLIKFPFGTALGIATLVILLGYRNSTLYEQL
jgi:hypothetical protein